MNIDILQDLPLGRVVAVDVESGGFSPAQNPLLSIGFCLGEATPAGFVHHDTREFYIRPPPGTILSVPTPETQGGDPKDYVTDYYLDVFTGERFEEAAKKTRPHIQSGAAAINHYVVIRDGRWDLDSIREWHDSAAGEVGEVSALVESLLTSDFMGSPVHTATFIAHNAPFDAGYIEAEIPHLWGTHFPRAWFCTQRYYRRVHNGGKAAGTSLGACVKVAGWQDAADHSAAVDARGCAELLGWMARQ